MKELRTSGSGKLYDANGFLVPVLTGTWHDMGQQYGALMVNHMQRTWDVLVAAALEKGATTADDVRRFENMTARLVENEGKVNAAVVRNLMDLRLFDEDGSFVENGGCTKPSQQDADLTNHTVVTDVEARTMWMKVPVPEHFQDWTEINVGELWS